MSDAALEWARKQTVGGKGAKALLLELAFRADDKNTIEGAPQADLAEVLECSAKTVGVHMAELEEGGYIVRERRQDEFIRLADSIWLPIEFAEVMGHAQ